MFSIGGAGGAGSAASGAEDNGAETRGAETGTVEAGTVEAGTVEAGTVEANRAEDAETAGFWNRARSIPRAASSPQMNTNERTLNLCMPKLHLP